MKLLQLLPIGDIDARFLMELAPVMANVYRLPTEIVRNRLDPEFAYHPERQQYHSSEILQGMQSQVTAESWRVLGVTAVDLYIPILTFVFGEAQIGGPCGLVSIHRLRQDFYGLPPDGELLQRRLIKESVHELGHTLELTHCDDYQCAMAPSHAVEWIDLKDATLCGNCQGRILAG
jgi:archaemetzincin